MAKTYHLGRVRNARAAGEVVLSRAGRSERLRIEEATPERSASILKRYLKPVPVVRPFSDVTAHSQLADFVAEVPRHPVFGLTPTSGSDYSK